MSIIIKGMDVPESCVSCPVHMELCDRGYHYFLDHPELYERRADSCPISEVPPHGELIEKHDVFRLISAFPEVDKLLPVQFMQALYKLPTAIPAEPPKEKT